MSTGQSNPTSRAAKNTPSDSAAAPKPTDHVGAQRCDRLAGLRRGDSVERRSGDKCEFQGTIEDYSEDRNADWVRLQGFNERKLLLADGVQVLRS